MKGVAIGCAGAATIAHTHSPAFIDRPGVTLGRLDGNPFQETLREIAARTSLRFAVNAGHERARRGRRRSPPATRSRVQRSLAAACAAAWLRPVGGRFDVLVAGVHAPKSDSLYQASRAATYIGLAARPALADGGLLILCADLPKGAGDGPGERNFAAAAGRRAAGRRSSPAAGASRSAPAGSAPSSSPSVLEPVPSRRARLRRARPFSAPSASTPVPTLDAALAAEAARLGRPPRVLAVADAMATVVHEA